MILSKKINTIDSLSELSADKILLIHSSSIIHVKAIVSRIIAECQKPIIPVTVLTHASMRMQVKSIADELPDGQQINILTIPDESKYSIFSLSILQFKKLCKCRTVIIPQNNTNGYGYGRIEALVFLLFPKKVITININNEARLISRTCALKKLFFYPIHVVLKLFS